MRRDIEVPLLTRKAVEGRDGEAQSKKGEIASGERGENNTR